MKKHFKDVEDTFEQLKKEFRQGVIQRGEFIEKLKKLKIKDKDGRFWMIGAQSGKWYYFDGKNWILSDPPSLKEGKAVCIYCGFENDLKDNVCAGCGGNLSEEEKDTLKPYPTINQSLEGKDYFEAFEEKRGADFLFRSVSPFSFLLFWGVIGLIFGVILGAFTGVSEYFPSVVKIVPGFLQEFQGKFFGGIIYAALGGVAGFLVLGVFGFMEALIINVISSLVGGIKIKISRQ